MGGAIGLGEAHCPLYGLTISQVRVTPPDVGTEETMDKKKEGLITSTSEALTEAAKINIAAAKEMASSAVTAFVD